MDDAIFVDKQNLDFRTVSGMETVGWYEGVTGARDSTSSNYYVSYEFTQMATGFSFYVTKRTSSVRDDVAVNSQNNYKGYTYRWLAIG